MWFLNWLADRNFSAVIGLVVTARAFISHHSTLVSGESEAAV